MSFRDTTGAHHLYQFGKFLYFHSFTVRFKLFVQVLSDKWTFMKEEQRKKMEKKQEFRNVEEQKKESFSGKEKLKRTTEVYLKDEVSMASYFIQYHP